MQSNVVIIVHMLADFRVLFSAQAYRLRQSCGKDTTDKTTRPGPAGQVATQPLSIIGPGGGNTIDGEFRHGSLPQCLFLSLIGTQTENCVTYIGVTLCRPQPWVFGLDKQVESKGIDTPLARFMRAII